MAKKKVAMKARPTKVSVQMKTDVVSVEAETIKRVDKTISTLEVFLSKWDASKLKPDHLFPHVIKIRKFYQVLQRWQKEATTKKKVDEATRARRLREFVFICKTYS